MHRGDSKICRPTADRHSTCSVLNKTAPCTRADGTQSIRTRLNPAKPYQAAKNQADSRYKTLVAGHCNFAYSALASFRMGMSGSASFQRAKNVLTAADPCDASGPGSVDRSEGYQKSPRILCIPGVPSALCMPSPTNRTLGRDRP